MSHLGRPKDGPDPKYSMKVTADHLATLLPGVKVKFVGATTGPEAEAAAGTQAGRGAGPGKHPL